MLSPMREDQLLTVQAAARELGVSHMTIRRWIDAKVLHPIRPGREYLIDRDDLERLRDPANRPQPGRPRKSSPFAYPPPGEYATGRLLCAADGRPEYGAE